MTGRTHSQLGRKPDPLINDADVTAMLTRLGIDLVYVNDLNRPISLDDVFALVASTLPPASCHWGVSYNAMTGDWYADITPSAGKEISVYSPTPHLALLWALDVWVHERSAS